MSERSTELSAFLDLSRQSVIPDPIGPEIHATPSASATGVSVELDKTEVSEASKERKPGGDRDSPAASRPNLTLLKPNVETATPTIGLQSNTQRPEEIEETRRSRLLTALRNSKLGRSYLRVIQAYQDLAFYMNDNKGFYGSSSAAASACFMRFDALQQTGPTGVSLAGILWVLILLLGNEFDRLRRLAAAALELERQLAQEEIEKEEYLPEEPLAETAS